MQKVFVEVLEEYKKLCNTDEERENIASMYHDYLSREFVNMWEQVKAEYTDRDDVLECIIAQKEIKKRKGYKYEDFENEFAPDLNKFRFEEYCSGVSEMFEAGETDNVRHMKKELNRVEKLYGGMNERNQEKYRGMRDEVLKELNEIYCVVGYP